MVRDHRDLVIECLGDELAELRCELERTAHERDIFRDMAKVGIEQIASLTRQYEQLRRYRRQSDDDAHEAAA